MRVPIFVAGAAALCLAASTAFGATLSNGPGDGTLTVGVDGFGSFGSSAGGADTGDAVYDPVGAIEAAGTTYESAIAVSFGGTRPFATTGGIGSTAPIPNTNLQITGQTTTSLSSTFEVGFLNFSLEQSLTQSFDSGGAAVGTVLNQVYTITNTATVPNSFDIVRYLDGDLYFDGTLVDGGGRIFQNGNEILFETDSASGDDESTTFVGITAVGGTAPSTDRFEISEYDTLVENIPIGGPAGALHDVILGDNTGDGFIDEPYDVTMALRNEFTLGGGQTATYTTQTLFGNAVPPAPGSIEALPLLPADIDPNGAFVFNLTPGDIQEGETIYVDPVIAIGYTYQVTGADFDSVTAPTFAAVPDADGYTLEFTINGNFFSLALANGETVDFGLYGSGLQEFTITGIDPALLLDPTDAAAFVTGVAFENINSEAPEVVVLQTPITTDTDSQDEEPGDNNPPPSPVSEVPLPPSAILFGSALFGAGLLYRRRRSA